MLLSKFLLIVSPIGAILMLVTAPLLLTSMSANSVFVNGNNNNAYAQAGQEDRPTYFIRILPGASFQGNQHYSIPNAAVPADTTVAWINGDSQSGALHTVTSGTPGSNTGFFDSGAMPVNDRFLLTFNSASNLIGDFTYYCTIHPWIIAQISSNDTVVKGNSFEFRSGTGPTFDTAANPGELPRTLVAFHPIGMSINQADVMHYDFSITRNSDNQTLFAKQYDVQNSDFSIELIQSSESQAATLGLSLPISVGPDAGTPYTGAYHVAGDFFSEPGDYTLGVELMSIGANPPPQPMKDEFTMSVASGATATTNATAT